MDQEAEGEEVRAVDQAEVSDLVVANDKTAVKPAIRRAATGTRAASSRLRALIRSTRRASFRLRIRSPVLLLVGAASAGGGRVVAA